MLRDGGFELSDLGFNLAGQLLRFLDSAGSLDRGPFFGGFRSLNFPRPDG